MALTSPPFPCLPCRINLFTKRFEGPVLDHKYYAGGCSPHYILNTRFRKPYNVDSYDPQVCASQEAPAGQWGEHTLRSQPAWSRGPALGPASRGSVDASLFLFELPFFMCKVDSSILRTEWRGWRATGRHSEDCISRTRRAMASEPPWKTEVEPRTWSPTDGGGGALQHSV